MQQRCYIDERRGWGPYRLVPGAPRPPVVLITMDMVPPEFYRTAGTNAGLARTPNIDELRTASVEFTNAFTNAPLCGPSRASYLTGRYPYILANDELAHDGWQVRLRPDDVIFPQYLSSTGYVAKHAGKSHIGAGKFIDAFGETDAPWNRWAPPMQDDDAYVAHLARLGATPPVYKNPVHGLAPDRTTPTNIYGGIVTQADGSAFPEEATYPHYLAALAAERIQAAFLQGAEAGAPLYLQVDFFAPHQPFMIPTALENRAAELRKAVTVPESFYNLRDRDFIRFPGEPRIYELYRKDMGLYEEDTVRNYIVYNILQMEVLDRAIGKVLSTLEERGVYENALVILAADHGEMNGEKALLDKGVYGHPKVARIPLLVKLPGAAPRTSTVEEPVCLLDLAPTILEAAGVAPDARLDGWSLWPLLSGAADKAERSRWQERTFLYEAASHAAPNPAVAIQWQTSPDKHYFYVCNLTSDCDELYDLADTTHTNLAPDPKHRDALTESIKRMHNFLSRDPRWRCYSYPFDLAHSDVLPQTGGDKQMFRPE